jgi:hypothetical protein
MEEFAKLLAARLARQGQEASEHPAADVLTAFAEKRLRRKEREGVVGHLAICGECREVVARIAVGVEESVEKERTNWWHWRWAAVLAAACVVGVVVWRPAADRRLPAVQKTASAMKATPQLELPAAPVVRPTEQKTIAKKVFAAPNLAPVPRVSRQQVVVDGTPKTDQVAPEDNGGLSFIEGTPPQAPVPAPMSSPVRAMTLRGSPGMFAKAMARPGQRESLWSLNEGAGGLKKSEDGGKTWVSIRVAGRVHFWALSATGGEIWAGGEDGMLFHSVDDGAHWSDVAVMDGEARMMDGITGIETEGAVVQVRTTGGEFRSRDRGASWVKQ